LSGVAPQHLELEITESVAMQDPAHIQAMMQRLKALGVRVAIDDFGTGFSSLSYLDKLPADRLKIDRSFIRHHSPDSDQQRIAPMIIGLAHSLGMRVIAEGVEDETQAEWLAQLGCHEAQGYYFGRPMSGDELDAWLRVHYPRHPDCPDPL
jgi:EAL domain-containing protein (putative c-di-GMP-specific phosphodiesterase class I)